MFDSGPGQHVAAEVEPVRIARLGAQPPADPVLRLQHHQLAIAQLPGRRQAGDPAAHHHHVEHVAHDPNIGCSTTASPSGTRRTPTIRSMIMFWNRCSGSSNR